LGTVTYLILLTGDRLSEIGDRRQWPEDKLSSSCFLSPTGSHLPTGRQAGMSPLGSSEAGGNKRGQNYYISLYTNTLCAFLASLTTKKKANYLSDKEIK